MVIAYLISRSLFEVVFNKNWGIDDFPVETSPETF